MKNKITVAFLCLFFIGATFAQQKRTCHTMEDLEERKSQDPGLEKRMEQIEQFTQERVKKMESRHSKVAGNIITIPVVVHVLYTNSSNNISDAQILSQIAVLNKDFRRTNSDKTNKWSQAADTQIEFAMAKVDPNGNQTTAITRKQVNGSDWGNKFKPSNAMKSSSTGGVNPWKTSEYLNMWIVPKMTNTSPSGDRNILGFAQFPGGSAATDGLVMIHDAFGSTGTLNPSFNLGRTTTHEIGHFLNLRHIWGDSNCGNDQVSDTPTAQTANYGCASGNISCGSEDMVQNYMDYSDDACMNLFTTGQKNRMRTVLEAGGSRRALALSDKFGTGGGSTPSACTSTISSFPYTESFESGTGAWTQERSDSFDWTRDADGTPSASTGPSSAAAGRYYMFTESSDPNYPTKTAIFNSPCFDLKRVSSPKMKFKYHMYGSSMGTLKLEVQEEGSTTWRSVWSKSGDQGNSWKNGEVSLSSKKVKVRFNLTTAASYRSDAAIDAISVESGSSIPTPTPISYCNSKGNRSTSEWIDNVELGGMTNVSSENSGYGDFTSKTATLARGSSSEMIISAGFQSTAYKEYWGVWIDFNQDGTFSDIERVVSGSSSSANNLTSTVTVPSSALLGQTRMRVSMKYNANQTACETFDDGEVEDYTVNIVSSARQENPVSGERLGNEEALSFMVYPNPAVNNIHIKLASKATTVTYKIVNVIGGVVQSGRLNSSELDVSGLNTGMYILEVNDGQKLLTTKLIKK